MFYSDRFPPYWEPQFDNHGNCINEPKFETPDATIFLKSSLQGEFSDNSSSDIKQISLRLPVELYADIEAVSRSGTLSRNSVIVSLLTSGCALLSDSLSQETINKLNSLSRQIKSELDNKEVEDDTD